MIRLPAARTLIQIHLRYHGSVSWTPVMPSISLNAINTNNVFNMMFAYTYLRRSLTIAALFTQGACYPRRMLTVASELDNNQQELARLARSEGIFARDDRDDHVATGIRRRPRLFHGARHGRIEFVQRRADGFHGGHNGDGNAARDNGVFNGGCAALAPKESAQDLHQPRSISLKPQHNGPDDGSHRASPGHPGIRI